MADDVVYRCELCKAESVLPAFVIGHGAICPVLKTMSTLPMVVSFVPTLPTLPEGVPLPTPLPQELRG